MPEKVGTGFLQKSLIGSKKDGQLIQPVTKKDGQLKKMEFVQTVGLFLGPG